MQLVLNIAMRAFLLVVIPLQAGAAIIQLRRTAPDPVGAGSVVKQAQSVRRFLPGTEEEKKAKHDQKMMDAISKFRAEICFDMKKEHGQKFSSYEACEKFMTKTCKPGKDDKMDGDSKEVTSGEGFCLEYFPLAEKKAEAVVKEEEDAEAIEEAKVHMVGPGPAPGPFPAPAPAPAPAAGSPGPAPAPGPMNGPAPGPVPAPFRPGVSHGKPHGHIPDDEDYYYAKGGKSPDRLHMSERMKLPTQGYWGKLVEHEDMKTSIEDWGHEFGPMAGHASAQQICAQHPESSWCREQGYHRHHRSSCTTVAANVVSLVCAIVAMRAF